ncbi:glycoside hydrolase family 5 protein [Hyaloscypha variabilis F]|uniref:mannan endo-1,4-beta-mannosidase n=1 Tax=Hyaloscypha variabilis (strain UAMH 11265 / GT02V1 / F) TaxID=1149755 RepID=A0A2J6RJJ5_HYAVF|nr:glycoside hydrolase family 5 protein [Hyaloscypha variabilis F]
MRLLQIILLSVVGLTTATPFLTDSVNQERDVQELSSSDLQKRATFPSASGLKFNIDGSTSYYAGTNSYWIGFLTSNTDVDTVMSHLKASGLKVLRVWGFNDVTQSTSGVWYQSFIKGQQPQINTGANGLQRLDYVVSSAASHGIKLIINFVNNWSDYGGMPAYNTFYGTTKTTWYTDSKVQAQYQAYIKAVVSRYLNSTAIFAWELANEPRCNACSTSIVTQWATKTSAYIKGLDPNHMVTMGDEGFMNGGGDGSYPYTTGEGMDFEANLKIPDIDFGTFHLYPSSWSETNAWGSPWITNHGAVCAKVGKPCILEEYGVTSNKPAAEGPWQTTALSTTGIAGDMFWQFGDTLSSGKTADDGNTIFYGTSDYTTLVTQHVAAINAKS